MTPTWRDVSPEELARLEKMELGGDVCGFKKGDSVLLKNVSYSEKSNNSKSKYRNQKTRGFHSKKEADRYDELVMMQKADVIRNLRCQVPYLLQEAFRSKDGIWHRKIEYYADFVYEDRLQADWIEITEDSKGYRNDLYKLKLKLLLYKYPDINFLET